MSAETVSLNQRQDYLTPTSNWQRFSDFVRRVWKSPSARIGGVIVLITLALGIGVPLLDNYQALGDSNLRTRYQEPDCVVQWLRGRLSSSVEAVPWSEISCDFPMGADKNGRDVMTRVGHGFSASLRVAILAVVVSLSVGASTGLIAGYAGGALDSLFMRLMDVLLAFPSLLLAIAIVSIFESPSLEKAMIAVAVTQIPLYARLARSMAISIRNMEYVTAANSIGTPAPRIILTHILPNSVAPLIVQSTLGLGTAVIETAALGFLGLGQQGVDPELGKMLAESQQGLASGKWWIMVFPGAAIILIVLGFNLLGDGLRDVLDPRLKK